MNITSLYVGNRCNLDCKYCHRVIEQDAPLNEDYIKKINGNVIAIKGGEPLMYVDTLKRIRELAPDSQISIVTNGKYLKENLGFLKDNKITFYVSYDFDDGFARSYVPDMNIGVPIRTVTLNYHGNCDLIKIVEKAYSMSQEYGNTITPTFHIMYWTSDKNKPLAPTKDDFDMMLEQHKWVAKHFDKKKYNPFFQQWQTLKRNRYSYGETRCMGAHSERITADGQRYTCTYVRDTLLGKDMDECRQIVDRFPKCKSCKYYSMCGASCVQSKNHDLECYYFENLCKFINGEQ